MRVGHTKVGPILATAALFFSAQIPGQRIQGQTIPSPASPQAVCAFIVGRMTTLLPQQPTLCTGKPAPNPTKYYSISIFSPTNVLEGNIRRAWSSALFQTLEELAEDKSLNGACSVMPVCIANISDAYMAQRDLRYRTVLSRESILLLRGPSSVPGKAEFSDHWYISWWRGLFSQEESDTAGSKENATQLGERACEDYIGALRKTHTREFSQKQGDHLAKDGGTVVGIVQAHPDDTKPPSCSVMLATDKTIYLSLDFADLIDALNPANLSELSPTFGKMFDTTGHDGQVLVRSAWDDSGSSTFRVFYIFPLRAIEFAYEEEESGLRGEIDVGELLRTEFEANGQISENTFENSILAYPAVVRYAPGPDSTVIVDMTDGAEWKISKDSFDRCDLHQGDKIDVSTLLISGNTASTDAPPTLSKGSGGEYCKLTAAFVKGW